MTNDMKFETGNFANSMALSIASGKADYSRERETARLVKGFCIQPHCSLKTKLSGCRSPQIRTARLRDMLFPAPGSE